MALEILRYDQHTAIAGGKIRDNRFFGLRSYAVVQIVMSHYKVLISTIVF